MGSYIDRCPITTEEKSRTNFSTAAQQYIVQCQTVIHYNIREEYHSGEAHRNGGLYPTGEATTDSICRQN